MPRPAKCLCTASHIGRSRSGTHQQWNFTALKPSAWRARDIIDIGLVIGEQRRRGIGEDLVARAAEQLVERHAGVPRRHVPEGDVDQRMGLRHHRRAEIAHAVPKRLAIGRRLADEIGEEARSVSPTERSKPCGVIIAAPAMPCRPLSAVSRRMMLTIYWPVIPSAQV